MITRARLRGTRVVAAAAKKRRPSIYSAVSHPQGGIRALFTLTHTDSSRPAKCRRYAPLRRSSAPRPLCPLFILPLGAQS